MPRIAAYFLEEKCYFHTSKTISPSAMCISVVAFVKKSYGIKITKSFEHGFFSLFFQ